MANDDDTPDPMVGDEGLAEKETSSPLLIEDEAIEENCADETATQIASIVDRISDNLFPHVLPSQQSALNEEEASHMLTFVQKTETVKIQSFIEEEYKQYRSSAIVASDSNEAQIRAQWSREHYYVCLRQYDEQNVSQNTTFFDSLLPLLHEEATSENKLQEIKEKTLPLQLSDTQAFVAFLDREWETSWSSLPKFAQRANNKQKLRKYWFSRDCSDLITEYILEKHARVAQIFVPEISVDEYNDTIQKERATSLFSKVQEDDIPLIEERVDTCFQTMVDKLPAFVQKHLDENMRRNFLIENYCDIIEAVFAQSNSNTTKTSNIIKFVPEIAAGEFTDAQKQKEIEILYSKVTEEHIELIKEWVESTYKEEVNKLPEFFRKNANEQFRQEFLKDNYCDIIQSVIDYVEAEKFHFCPEVPPESFTTEEKQREAAKVYATVHKEHVDKIEAAMNTAFESTLGDAATLLTEAMKIEIRTEFALQHYLPIVQQVVCNGESLTTNKAPAFVFKPEYELGGNATIEERDKVQKMLDIVSSEDAAAIKKMVTERFAAVCENTSSSILSRLGDKVKQAWLENNYYKIVAEVVNHKLPVSSSSHSSSTLKRSQEQIIRPDIGLFASPKKRVKTANTPVTQETTLVTKTISDLHLQERPHVDTLHLIAVALYFSPPLYLKVSDRKKTKIKKSHLSKSYLQMQVGP